MFSRRVVAVLSRHGEPGHHLVLGAGQFGGSFLNEPLRRDSGFLLHLCPNPVHVGVVSGPFNFELDTEILGLPIALDIEERILDPGVCLLMFERGTVIAFQ